jgi:hypothetical protein
MACGRRTLQWSHEEHLQAAKEAQRAQLLEQRNDQLALEIIERDEELGQLKEYVASEYDTCCVFDAVLTRRLWCTTILYLQHCTNTNICVSHIPPTRARADR